MIYVHAIMEIFHATTNVLISKEEKLLKFKNEDEVSEYSFNVVKQLDSKHYSYPGNGRVYADFSTRTLTDDEIKFLGLPA